MFCPQCGTESSSGQQYCRSCGANLKFIGKAVSLSEAIARSDRGPVPRIKEMVQGLKDDFTQGPRAEEISEEVSGALDRMNKEILSSFSAAPAVQVAWAKPKAAETPELRRENHIVKGASSLFGGVGLMVFLYYFSAALVLKIPPDALARIPFEVEPVARMIWLVGLIPTLTGFGHLTAGLLIGARRGEERKAVADADAATRQFAPTPEAPRAVPASSVTEGTTELLDDKAPTGHGR